MVTLLQTGVNLGLTGHRGCNRFEELNPAEQKRFVRPRPAEWAGLAGLTAAAVAIHGYHVGIEDQAIYLPAIVKHLHPSLFPRDAIFFEAQTRPILLDEFVAWTVRFTHIPMEWVLLLFHLATIFILLFASWRIARRCWKDSAPVWAGLGLVTAMLTLPIAGTSQYIVDQYLHPRALATALMLIPIADLLPGEHRMRGMKLFGWCALWFAIAVVLHLQLAVFGLAMIVFMVIPWERWIPVLGVAVFIPPIPVLGKFLEPGSPAWTEAARTRSQHYLMRWEWYELLGIIAPMFLLWWFGHLAAERGQKTLAWLCKRIAAMGTVVLVVGSALILPPQFERLTPYQPMRMFIYVYFFLLLIGGGLLGQFLLKRVPWRWVVAFVPMAVGMYIAQVQLFPNTPHIEWPGQKLNNDWVKAFLWVRDNTPENAYFALNPRYISIEGEDYRGFRAWAWRSQMADYVKDPGVATLVPDLAPEWQRQVHALDGWNHFTGKDFRRLHDQFGVDWVIVERQGKEVPSTESLDCAYQNASVNVCRIR